MFVDVTVPADRNVTQTKAENKWIQEFTPTDKTNVEHEMYGYTGNNWSHRNCNKRFKEKFVSHIRKTFNRFTTKDSYTRNITQYGKYCSLEGEAGAVGISAGSREVPGRKGLWLETTATTITTT